MKWLELRMMILCVRMMILCVVAVSMLFVAGYAVRSIYYQRMAISVESRTGRLVERVQEVECDTPTGWPVVVVRDVSATSEWWVQERCRVVRGTRFVSTSHFGNEQTPPGTRFQLVVLALRDAETAGHFTVGSRLEQLPSEVPHSEPVELVRQ